DCDAPWPARVCGAMLPGTERGTITAVIIVPGTIDPATAELPPLASAPTGTVARTVFAPGAPGAVSAMRYVPVSNTVYWVDAPNATPVPAAVEPLAMALGASTKTSGAAAVSATVTSAPASDGARFTTRSAIFPAPGVAWAIFVMMARTGGAPLPGRARPAMNTLYGWPSANVYVVSSRNLLAIVSTVLLRNTRIRRVPGARLIGQNCADPR